MRSFFALLAVAGCLLSSAAARAESVAVGGTGSVLGLLRALESAFARQHPGDTLEIVPGLGSAGAIAAVAQGAIDLAVTGRAPTAQERAAGLVTAPFIETPFVFATGTPTPARLTREDVVRIVAGEPFLLPGDVPARLILRPRSDAATLYLAASVEGLGAAMERARARADIPVAATDQDNLMLAGRIAGSFIGTTLTQLTTEPSAMRPAVFEGVAPSLAAMRSGAYPLRQRMLLVTRSEPSPATRRFLAFLDTGEASALIEQAGALRTSD